MFLPLLFRELRSDYFFFFHSRIYRWKLFQACMSSLKLSMLYHWGTLAFCLYWSISTNWAQDLGMYFNQLERIFIRNSTVSKHHGFLALHFFYLLFKLLLFSSSFFIRFVISCRIKIYHNSQLLTISTCWLNCRHLQLIQRIIPEIRDYFAKALSKPNPHNMRL